MLNRNTIFAAMASLLVAGSALAQDYAVGGLKIEQPWARATPKGASVGGGYLKIANTGTTADRLVGGASDVSERFEIHEMSMDGGVMKMRVLPKGLDVKPGQTVELKPGGYHVMFVGLKRPFAQGERIKATLQFEKAGKVDVEFVVGAIGGKPAGHSGGHGH